MKPVVALVGRPNVGKSTLFNRITHSKAALVDDLPGVTRDRNYGDGEWDGSEFTVVDTGGYLSGDEDHFAREIRLQVNQAIESADVIVMILDAKSGPSLFDAELVKLMRGLEKPIFFVVNKIDGPEKEDELYDFYQLGIEHLYPISAEHGYGVRDFLDDLTAVFPDREKIDTEAVAIKVAVVGRPNVGKSSLINRILGEQRMVVDNIPGTTRDAVDTLFQRDGRLYRFIDTAGIRRKGRVAGKLEKFSVIKAIKSLDRCHVSLVVLDAGEGITDQDITISGYAHERGCGTIFLLNKWDLVEKGRNTARWYMDELRIKSKFLNYAPAISISAKTGLRVKKIFPVIQEVYRQYTTRIGTGKLNRILENAVAQNEPSLVRGRRIKFYYFTQVSVAPPSFVCFVNYPEHVHFSYTRFLINRIREETGLDKTPIRLFCRKRGVETRTRRSGKIRKKIRKHNF